jgi:hypothetical protein
LHHDEAGGVESDAFDTTSGTVKVVSHGCGFAGSVDSRPNLLLSQQGSVDFLCSWFALLRPETGNGQHLSENAFPRHS